MLNSSFMLGIVLVVVAVIVSKQWSDKEEHGLPTEAFNASYDYIVIGAGSAGSVVAARLAENDDVTVLLVEAGGEDNAESIHVPRRAYENVMSEYDWKYPQKKPKYAHRTRVTGTEELISAGRVLGGGSSINFMQYSRGSPHDYDRWEAMGSKGWAYKDVLPYFLKSEDAQFDAEGIYHSNGGFLGVSRTPRTELYEYTLHAGKELNFPEVDHNGRPEYGISRTYITTKHGRRSNPAVDLIRKAMKQPNLDVMTRIMVTKIIFNGNRAIGVNILKDGKAFTIHANREVVLSAGAFGSPKLLMLSGIGPAEDLHQLNVPIVKDLPVGKTIEYHYFIALWVSTNHSYFEPETPSLLDELEYKVFKTGLLTQSLVTAVILGRTDGRIDGLPDFQFMMLPRRFPPIAVGITEHPQIEKGPGFTAVFFVSSPKSTGTVKFRSVNPLDNPIIDLNYFKEATDMTLSIEGVRFIQRLLQTKSMASINASLELSRIKPCEHEPFDSDAYWDCFIRHTVLSYHHTTTCKMGEVSDPTGVVDPRLRVKGIDGLRVIDASIMPKVPSGNTNAPVIMIAEKGVDMMLEDLMNNRGSRMSGRGSR